MANKNGEKLKKLIKQIVGPESFDVYTRKSNPDIIIINVSTIGVVVEIQDINVRPYEDSFITDEQWRLLAKKIELALNNAIYSALINDLKKIGEAYDYYVKYCIIDFAYPQNLNSERIDEGKLHDLCCDVFAYRIAFISKTIKKIIDKSYTDLVEEELVLGILLRSIVLDSILIMGWLHEPRFISEM